MTAHVALLLNAHLPFVRHPDHDDFLEEDWLYEAIIEAYLPLLVAFERLANDDVPYRISLALSPPLVSMLRDELLMSRCGRRIDALVELAEREVHRTRTDASFGPVARFYRDRLAGLRADFFDRYRRDLVAAFARLAVAGHLELMGGAATHGFLPLLTHPPSAARAQVVLGLALHRSAFGRTPAGFWLPECGYYPGCDGLLAAEGVRWTVLDAHGLTEADPPSPFGTFAPVFTPSGVAAFGRDPDTAITVWSAQQGYPGDADYRDFYRDIGFDLPVEEVQPFVQPGGGRKFTGLKYHRVTGSTSDKAPYDRDRALARVAVHAAHFVERRSAQARELKALMGGRTPIVVAPFDAELFGHWWFEGPEFLEAVFRRAAALDAPFDWMTPSDHLRVESEAPVAQPPMCSWGEGGYAAVWLDEANRWIYPPLHRAAYRMEELAGRVGDRPLERRAVAQAGRELLLAQASDWAFIMKKGTAVGYAVQRTRDHLERFGRIDAMVREGAIDEAWLTRVETRDRVFPNLDPRVWREEGTGQS